MSLNAANGSSSIYATPSRSERFPSQHQSSHPSPAHTPQRPPAVPNMTSASHSVSFSSASTSTASPTAVTKDRLLTSAYLLKTNASAEDPKLAALEQAVNDRNALSSQNAQLWKLIEKQRAGYNQILKELERIRGERDALKAKLGGLSGNGQDARHRGNDVDRNSKRSFSENAGVNRPSNDDSKDVTPRQYPDDQFRSQTLTLPPPPSSAPSMINIQSVNSATSTNSTKPYPTSSFMSPHHETLPLALSAMSTMQETNVSDQHSQQSSFQNSMSNASEMSPPTRPTTYPRRSSFAERANISQGTDIGSNDMNHGTPSSSTSSKKYYYHGGQTPHTAPVVSGMSSSDTYQILMTPVTSSLSQTSTTPLTSLTASQTTITADVLSAAPQNRPGMMSRDSRISLPDEARQYIANMSDSPVPSPRMDVFASKEGSASQFSQPQSQISQSSISLVPPVSANLTEVDCPGESSDFRDPGGGGGQGDHEADHDAESDNEELAAPGADEHMDVISLPSETPVQSTQVVPSQVDSPQLQTQGKLKPRIAVEHFPAPSGDMQLQTYPVHTHTEAVQQRGGTIAPVYGDTDHISPLENPYSPSNHNQQSQASMRLHPQTQPQPTVQSIPASFRALPLLPTDLPHTIITVSHSFVRPNDRGKEVLSFVVFVDPGSGKEGWKVEKMYSDVLGLDQRVRGAVGKGLGKKIVSLPEGKLWKDHAPAKVDQRKAVLENYLQTLIRLPARAHDEVIAFFTSDIVRERKQPVMQVGHKEGYLTKRGKNFGGWKTRYFVLQGPVLEYYDCRGGAHLGSIQITGAQIGRQQRSERAPNADEEKEYRHAFLIVETKKGPGGSHTRHVLCAESDEDRDAWVEILVRYFTGTYSEEPIKYGPPPSYQSSIVSASQPRSSSSSSIDSPTTRRPTRGFPRDDIAISRGTAVPISQLSQDEGNAKLFPPVHTSEESPRSSSPSKSAESPIDSQNANPRRLLDRGQGLPSSLPDSSPLSSVSNFNSDSSVGTSQRANSELGHYSDLNGRSNRQASPERHRGRELHDKHKSFHPSLNTVSSSPSAASPVERGASPEKLEASKVKISGPLNGAVIPSGFKFGKEFPSASDNVVNERRIKSRSFWGFGKPNGDKGNASVLYVPRAVFGVPLDESLEVAQIANLPAIVFRSIQYLEAKEAEQEEGIYRLSGSSAVIKNLKDRFNMEGDVDLLASDEYWDPHAIAGLLKSFLRELPASILTRDLHFRFLAVIDFVNPQERIKELSQLIAALPLANYSLLRALTAHLILIVQNSSVNKMTMRNVGIVFSPTLGIPAGVFSLMLGEFNRVFNVDDGADDDANTEDVEEEGTGVDRRNSKHYLDTAADQLLGLTGRTLKASAPDVTSDNDDASAQEESGAETTDNELVVDSSSEYGHGDGVVRVMPPDTPTAPKTKTSKASTVAATRGLNVSITGAERGVLFICFNVDHRILWGQMTKDAVDDGFQFYTTFFNAPPAIKGAFQALLHGMVGVGLVGLISKLHKWDESAMFFDGTSLGGFFSASGCLICVTIPALKGIVAPLEAIDFTAEGEEDKVQAIRVLSAGNIIVMVCLGAILFLQDGPGPYCSFQCRDDAEQVLVDDLDDDAIYRRAFHAPHARWSGNGPAGIAAWAADIPPLTRSRSSSPERSRRLPKLLRSHRRPAPPALGVTLPTTVLPSPAYPISTPRPQSTFCSSLSLESLGKQSLLSVLTESSLATPTSTFPLGVPSTKPSFFGTLATHVRSWVAPSPLVASSPVVYRDHPHLSPIAAKQHETQPKLTLFAQRPFDGPDTVWKLQTTILVAEPRSRGRNPART
ncbi:hypothetical protein C0993_010419 [Termitomyces sp. T159_Od127]|nr:hypothetical protein C0993_010419 [Termitomyces sp. T159_Od127]